MMKKIQSLAFASLVALSGTASAALVQVTEGGFIAAPGSITFSELSLGTVNPSYTVSQYGGDASKGSPTVTFGSMFIGQTQPAACGQAGSLVQGGCVSGSPSGTLALDSAGLPVRVADDVIAGSGLPTRRVLGGTNDFATSVAMLFGSDVYGLSFTLGRLNFQRTQISVRVFSATGLLLDDWTSAAIQDPNVTGELFGEIATYRIQSSDLANRPVGDAIRGVLVSFANPSLRIDNFAIDDVRFSQVAAVTPPPPPTTGVPEPTPLALVALGLLGVGLVRRSRR